MRRNSSHNKTPLLKQPPGSCVTYALAEASSLHTQGGAARWHVCAIHRFPYDVKWPHAHPYTYTCTHTQRKKICTFLHDTVVEYNALRTSSPRPPRANAHIVTSGSKQTCELKRGELKKGVPHCRVSRDMRQRGRYVPPVAVIIMSHVAVSTDPRNAKTLTSESLVKYLEITKLINDNN